jgi:hypothetical protein
MLAQFIGYTNLQFELTLAQAFVKQPGMDVCRACTDNACPPRPGTFNDLLSLLAGGLPELHGSLKGWERAPLRLCCR